MDFFLDPSGDFFEDPKPEKVRQSAADRKKQKELALERKRLEANRSFDEWWQLKPVRKPSEMLSTPAKVQIVRFLHDWDNVSPLRHLDKEWRYVSSRLCTYEAKELVKYVNTEGYRLTFGKCIDAEAAMALQAIDSGPLVFRDEAPLGLIQGACKYAKSLLSIVYSKAAARLLHSISKHNVPPPD
ncbi:hypothetical protein AAVH_19408 [Aphelenchoides avenae]|nr:hypothetical protein AAVH_19408 [Aphelenchus avenae]